MSTPFGTAFREARKRSGLTQSELGELSNVSRRTIIRWETGEVSPWIPELKAVLEALRLREEEIASLFQLLDTNRAKVATGQESTHCPGRLLRLARVRAELTTADVGIEMGCNASTVARWESEKMRPSTAESDLLLELLKIEPGEVAELGSPHPPLKNDADFEERLQGIVWPWDPDGYRLFDVRFLSLLDQVDAEGDPVRLHRARTAYAWMLCSAGRFREAAEVAETVSVSVEEGQIKPAPFVLLASIVSARASMRSGSERGLRRAQQILDGLDGRPLSWELLAARYDAYAELTTLKDRHVPALEYCDRAISAADRSGRRLGRLFRFNRMRVLRRQGIEISEIPAFSEWTPLNDVLEARDIAEISLGGGRREHWTVLANEISEKFGLAQVVDSNVRWGQAPLFGCM